MRKTLLFVLSILLFSGVVFAKDVNIRVNLVNDGSREGPSAQSTGRLRVWTDTDATVERSDARPAQFPRA